MASHEMSGHFHQLSKASQLLTETVAFLTPLLPLAGAHMVDFYVADHWNKILEPQLRKTLDTLLKTKAELLLNSTLMECEAMDEGQDLHQLHNPREFYLQQNLINIFYNANNEDSITDIDKVVGDEALPLLTLVRKIYAHSLPFYLKHYQDALISPSIEALIHGIEQEVETKLAQRQSTNNSFMSVKKEHEIPRMTTFINRLAEACKTDVVVDVGSGKGYLGQELACITRGSKSGLRVVGIEGNISTAHGALERHQKMKVKGRKLLGESLNSSLKDESTEIWSRISSQGFFSSIPVVIKNSTHLIKVVRETLDQQQETQPLLQQQQHQESHSETDINKFVSDYGSSNTSHNCHSDTSVLCGLHACGGLTPFILQSFIGMSSSEVAAVCVVGCCYHHLNEKDSVQDLLTARLNADEDVMGSLINKEEGVLKAGILGTHNHIKPLGNQPSKESDTANAIILDHLNKSDFPLSSVIADFRLGRSARMLGNQPPARAHAFRRLPDETLHLRAVLEVILREQYSFDGSQDRAVGKIKKNWNTPLEYLKLALAKLGIEKMLDDQILLKYLDKFEANRSQLFSFFQLRTCLAPVIETVILLDRLVFLLEAQLDQASDEYSSLLGSAIVKIFDAVKSPRCYAVIGLK